MSTAKLENKRAAVLGQCTRARRIPALLPSPLGNPSQSPRWEAPSRWRSGGTSPAASILARSRSLWLSPCSPRVPGVPCAALPAGAGGGSEAVRQLLQEGFDLHCLVWLFKYRSERWGNFRHVYPLLWERLKTHVSSYSPAGLLCLCVHMQHTHTLRCGRLGRAGKGEKGRRRGALGRGADPRALYSLPWAHPAWLHSSGGLQKQGAGVGLLFRKGLLWQNCPAVTSHTRDARSWQSQVWQTGNWRVPGCSCAVLCHKWKHCWICFSLLSSQWDLSSGAVVISQVALKISRGEKPTRYLQQIWQGDSVCGFGGFPACTLEQDALPEGRTSPIARERAAPCPAAVPVGDVLAAVLGLSTSSSLLTLTWM